MSELKATTVYDAYWKANSVGEGTGILVYLKSEADRYIALLKYKANYNEYAYKLKSEELADTCRFYEEELRHQKFKRCLAMAEWCENSWNDAEISIHAVNDMFNGTPSDELLFHHKFFRKWYLKWLELAEKFKEAK